MKGDQMGIRAAYPTPQELPLSNWTWFSFVRHPCAGARLLWLFVRRGDMKKASEYRRHADECRSLAKGLLAGEQRDQMLNMAGVWEKLAADRTTLILRHPELGLEGEHQEESAAQSRK